MTDKSIGTAIPAEPVVLRLYIAGNSSNSTEARANLQAFLAGDPNRGVTLDVVDVLTHPEEGLRAAVVVTPTLIRVSPRPEQRIIGNLRGRAALLATLVLGGEHHE